MKTSLSCVALIFVGLTFAFGQEHPSSENEAILTRWLNEQQFHQPGLPSYGALKIHPDVAATSADGTQYCRVNAYSANLALMGWLRTGSTSSKEAARLWIGWYFAHLTPEHAPDGVPCDHFYKCDGGGETSCVKAGDRRLCRFNDATDSAAATFLSVLWTAYRAGVSKADLNLPGYKQKIDSLADTLLKLQQADGLCWAKLDYRAKYLEDNCEVFAGLSDLAKLEREVFADPDKARLYAQAAERVQAGIFKELYDAKSKLYAVAKFEDNILAQANLDKWYPDTQAQLWPNLFGLVASNDPKTSAVVSLITKHWNGLKKPDWSTHPEIINNGSMEAGAACSLLQAGETARVHAYTQAVVRLVFPKPNRTASFKWPFTVDQAGWLLQILHPEGEK